MHVLCYFLKRQLIKVSIIAGNKKVHQHLENTNDPDL